MTITNVTPAMVIIPVLMLLMYAAATAGLADMCRGHYREKAYGWSAVLALMIIGLAVQTSFVFMQVTYALWGNG